MWKKLILINILLGTNLLLAQTPLVRELNHNFLLVKEVATDFGINQDIKKAFTPIARKVAIDNLKIAWPLKEAAPKLVSRFGTPVSAIDAEGSVSFFHEALDIKRSSSGVAEDVIAPVSGLATITYDTDVDSEDAGAYSSAVSILDENSGAVVTVMHLTPAKNLIRHQFIKIKVGDVIGKMVQVSSMLSKEDQEEFKHVHLFVSDLKNESYLNPIRFMPQYDDSISPTINNIYLINSAYEKVEQISEGEYLAVVDVFDRDNFSEFNFEISKIQYKIETDRGEVLSKLETCSLDDLVKPIEADKFFPVEILDLKSNQSIQSDRFPFKTDAANPLRSFKYIMSKLSNDAGKCTTREDAASPIFIPAEAHSITISGRIEDVRGNSTPFVKTLKRK